MNISLIIPCYNEESNLQKGVLDKVGNFTQNDNRFIEVAIVDDGSTDNSKIIIKRYLNIYPKFRLIENQHKGKAFAISTGIKSAQGNFVIFTDIDLATPIEETNKLIENAEKGFEIVIGSRKSSRIGAPILRKILSFGAIIVRSILFRFKNITDTQCGFKLYEKKAAMNILNKSQLLKESHNVTGASVTAAFDLEFIFIAFKLKYKVKETPVHWRHMETRNVNFIKDAIETLKDIAKIKFFEFQGKYEE